MIEAEPLPGMKESRRARMDRRADEAQERRPPHDAAAEQGVLGCVLLEPAASMGICMERMKGDPALFYDLRHQTIFTVLRQMYEANEGMDLITVQAQLGKRGVLEEVGGVAYLSELQDAVPSAANLTAYLTVVREKYLMRRAIATAAAMVSRICDAENEVPAETLLLECEAQISALTEAETPATEQHIKSVMSGVIADMEQWHYSRGSQQLRGLPMMPAGAYLDKVLTGIRETHFVTVAARPGGGKSALALNVVEYLAEKYVWYEPTGKKITNADGVEVDEAVKRTGIPVAVFSIEMDSESLGYRLMFGRAGVSEAKFNQGFAESGDAEKLVRAAHDLSRLNIYLDDTPAQTINQIAAKARRMAKQYGIKLFVLDYLQLAESDDPRDETRVRVNKISKKIVALKKQLKVPWLVLAQLNRNIETAERDRNPVLSDLAESGAIEQDSDKVIILKKTPRRDLEQEKADGGPADNDVLAQVCGGWEWSRRPQRVDAWVVKNRRGPTGKAELLFQGNLCRFADWHLWKLEQGVEERKAGESKYIAAPDEEATQTEMGMDANNNNQQQEQK